MIQIVAQRYVVGIPRLPDHERTDLDVMRQRDGTGKEDAALHIEACPAIIGRDVARRGNEPAVARCVAVCRVQRVVPEQREPLRRLHMTVHDELVLVEHAFAEVLVNRPCRRRQRHLRSDVVVDVLRRQLMHALGMQVVDGDGPDAADLLVAAHCELHDVRRAQIAGLGVDRLRRHACRCLAGGYGRRGYRRAGRDAGRILLCPHRLDQAVLPLQREDVTLPEAVVEQAEAAAEYRLRRTFAVAQSVREGDTGSNVMVVGRKVVLGLIPEAIADGQVLPRLPVGLGI